MPDVNAVSLLGQSQSILGQQSSDTPGGFPKGDKTRLCTQYAETGMCPRGDQCTFAHGGHEVKGFKTKLCKYEAGLCPSGDKCSFAHSAMELQLGQQTLPGDLGATQPSNLDSAQASPSRVAGLATETLLGAWSSLSATDLAYLSTL